jgi:hypothetical protein
MQLINVQIRIYLKNEVNVLSNRLDDRVLGVFLTQVLINFLSEFTNLLYHLFRMEIILQMAINIPPFLPEEFI